MGCKENVVGETKFNEELEIDEIDDLTMNSPTVKRKRLDGKEPARKSPRTSDCMRTSVQSFTSPVAAKRMRTPRIMNMASPATMESGPVDIEIRKHGAREADKQRKMERVAAKPRKMEEAEKEAKHREACFEGNGGVEAVETRKRHLFEPAEEATKQQGGKGAAEGGAVKKKCAKCPHKRIKSECWECEAAKEEKALAKEEKAHARALALAYKHAAKHQLKLHKEHHREATRKRSGKEALANVFITIDDRAGKSLHAMPCYAMLCYAVEPSCKRNYMRGSLCLCVCVCVCERE